MPVGYTPEELALMQQFMQGGGQDPSLDPYTQDFLSTLLQYPVTSKGVPEYYDVDTQNKMQNALQDRQQTLFDPGNAMMTGGLSAGAFNPIVDEKQLDFPETGTLSVMAQTQGVEGTLAGLILGGQSASQAMMTLQDMIANPAKNGLSDAEAQGLEASLMNGWGMPDQVDPTKIAGVDWGAVTKTAEGMAKPFLTEQGIKARAMDPSSGVISRNGKYFQTSETPSPMTEWLRKQGLDNPNTQYGPDYLRASNPDFGGIESSLGQGMSALGTARQTFTANEAERQRQADLLSRYTSQDQAAMDRFGRGVQGGLQDYFGSINRDMTSTPQWGEAVNPDPRRPWATQYDAGSYVGDPTAIPQLLRQTPTQGARDQRLMFDMADMYGGPSHDPAQIQQALRDYMTSALHEPTTDVPGHPGSTMVGSAGRGPGFGGGLGPTVGPDGQEQVINNLPGYINSQRGPGVVTGAEVAAQPHRKFGISEMPTLPGLPQLSAYGDPAAAQRAAMAFQLLGQTALTKDKGAALRRKAEQAGRVLPSAVRPKAIDEAMRAAAHTQTNAAQWAYAKALLPAYLAQRAGRTPFQDEMLARAQSMRAVGSIG